MTIYIFDTETGGLDSKACGLTEVSAIVIDASPDWSDFRVINRFSSLVRPVEGLEYSDEALQLQGRTLDQLATEGRAEGEVIGALTKFVARYFGEAKKCSPFAHNSAFDMGFMESACARTGLAMPTNFAHICTMHMFRALRFAGVHDSYKATLDAMTATLGVDIPPDVRHTATGDVEATAACLVRMMRIMHSADLRRAA